MPVLPGVEPASGTSVSASGQQRRSTRSGTISTDMFYDPDTNIVPLAPAEMPSAG